MNREFLDYESSSPTFALAFSPLSTSSFSTNPTSQKSTTCSTTPPPIPDLRLAIGSYVQAGRGDNHVTVVGLDPMVLYQQQLEMQYGSGEYGPGGSGSNAWGGDQSPDVKPNPHGQRPLRNASLNSFVPLARGAHTYPVTALDFAPTALATAAVEYNNPTGVGTMVKREILATTSDSLRLWDFVTEDVPGSNSPSSGAYLGKSQPIQSHRMTQKLVLSHAKSDYSAPLTAFSWSVLDPSMIVTSSIDTTCSIWDVTAQTAITQLIAHDKEVYDVAWSPASKDVFASVGADGSVRMFDLRSLEHSTILYEAAAVAAQQAAGGKSKKSAQNGSSSNPNGTSRDINPASTSYTLNPSSPLLRLAFNPSNPNMVSVFHANSNYIQILDVRSPGTPLAELKAHKAPVNGMAWSPVSVGDSGEKTTMLATCADDCQLLLWDPSTPNSSSSSQNPPSNPTPSSSSRRRDKEHHSSSPQSIRDPLYAYTASSELNSVCWSRTNPEWIAVGMGRTVRCLRMGSS